MVITIFQDKNGKYLEKNGKLILKGIRSKASDGNVKMGTQVLSLHILANDYEKQDITFQFSDSKGKNIGSIDTEVQAKYLGEGGDDDASSVMSGASFQSVSHSDVLQSLGSKQGSVGSSYSEDRKAPSVESRASTVNTSKHQDYQAEYGLRNTFTTNVNKSLTSIEEKFDTNERKYPTKRKTMKEMKAEEKLARSDSPKQTMTTLPTKTPILSPTKNPVVTSNSPIIETGKEILSLQIKLKESINYNEHLENEFQNKMTSMIERMIEVEDERDLEHHNHEQQIIKLLRAAKIYDKSQYDINNSENNLKLTDMWVKLISKNCH
eukprot:CAMPEP_0119050354 /NCGR_PEP_ID=MMETSP1177-20130426/69470_1 /TAXON_ID=2985 /ORGANISM="Ochromonas sp, Strain CCMP1899" /LENGTH=321 /DNA_ID=CAMNT_0007028661 /DNA_START=254 /DNA_END=1219 /DNA_ORIENTATION=+